MIAPVFVDTNVFLYARDAGEPSKRPLAAAWLEHLWREQLGRTSCQVLSEYYVNVTRKLVPGLSFEEAWDDVEALLSWKPVPIDRTVLEAGKDVERRHGLSWWDSLIVGAARVQGCALLLTEDLQDGTVLGGVTVRSPFTLGVTEASTTYRVASTVGRHPKRGRPPGRKSRA